MRWRKLLDLFKYHMHIELFINLSFIITFCMHCLKILTDVWCMHNRIVVLLTCILRKLSYKDVDQLEVWATLIPLIQFVTELISAVKSVGKRSSLSGRFWWSSQISILFTVQVASYLTSVVATWFGSLSIFQSLFLALNHTVKVYCI